MKTISDLPDRLFAHKVWVESKGARGRRLILTGVDVAGSAEGPGVFEHKNLTMAIFRNCNLAKIRLWHSEVLGANFDGSCLDGALIKATVTLHSYPTTFRGASMQGVVMDYSSSRNLDLQGADLRNANLEHCSFRDSNLAEANLSNANLHGASFHGCCLENTILPDPKLEVGKVYVLPTKGGKRVPHVLVRDDGESLTFLGPTGTTLLWDSWRKWTCKVKVGKRGDLLVE